MVERPESPLARGPLARPAATGAHVIVLLALGWLILWVLVRLRVVTVPLIIALLLTALLAPGNQWLVKRGVPRLAATWLMLLGFLAVLSGMVTLTAFMVSGQIDELSTSVMEGWEQVREWLRTSTPVTVPDEDLGGVLANIGEQLSTATLVSGLMTALEVAAGVILVLFFTFFMVKDGPELFRLTVSQFSGDRRKLVEGLGREMWAVLSSYMRGLTAIALFNSLLKGLALVLIGIPLVVPLMMITFIGSYIPFAGPIVAGALAALVALAEGGLVDAALILGAAILIQQVEGNVFQPVVYGRSLDLHPIVIVATVTAGAVLAGIAGALLAVPVVAIVTTIYTHVRAHNPGHAEGKGPRTD